jgi:hypothetical protein
MSRVPPSFFDRWNMTLESGSSGLKSVVRQVWAMTLSFSIRSVFPMA